MEPGNNSPKNSKVKTLFEVFIVFLVVASLMTIFGIAAGIYLSYGWEGFSMLPEIFNPKYW